MSTATQSRTSLLCMVSGKEIDEKWSKPFGDRPIAYMGNVKAVSIKELYEKTVRLGKNIKNEEDIYSRKSQYGPRYNMSEGNISGRDVARLRFYD